MHRIKEIGLRKSLGASRFMLRVQLIFESFVITLLAASVGSVITYFILPAFNELIDGSIVWQITLLNFGFILLLSFLISLISGTVQAGILVSVTPLSALKGTTAFSSKESWLNQGLIILQFTLSALLITGTLIMRDQMNFIQQKDLGFDKDRLIEISLHTSGDLDATKQLIDRYKTTVQLNPLIKNMAGTMNSFLEPWTQLSFRQIDGSSEDIFFNQIDVDYLNTMNIKLVSGKNFNEVGGSNVTDIIVNEALVKHFEWDSPYDKQIPGRNFDKNHRIVGVIEDFHFSSLHNKIAPIILAIDQGSIASGVTGLNTYVWPPNLYRTVVRVGQGELSEAVSFLEESWKQVNPGKPFTYDFVDDVLANNYSEEARWNKVINYASIFAIVIAWMGLLGLTRLSVQKRTKEIGIRKVLGSSALKVTTALSMRFLFLVVIATAISWPIAWLAMGKWLESFSYRVDLSAMTFIVASAGILIISLFSVGMQAYRAAIANPVESLKYE
jgi:putative ABC transport system permease protein